MTKTSPTSEQKRTGPYAITNIMFLVALGLLVFGVGFKFGEFSTVQSFSPETAENIDNIEETQELIEASTENVDFGLFWETWNKLDKKFIGQEQIDHQQMFYGAVKGMVASLDDPYTFFLTPEENNQSKDDLGGRFEGIGAQLGLEENRIVIVAPLKNSPAEQAGVQAGDVIVSVDGESTDGWTLNDAVSTIRGEQGTTVSLGLERDGEELTIDVVRDTIQVDSVELEFETTAQGQVAHLRLNQFGDSTNTEWADAVDEVRAAYEDGTIDGLIVDVRGNPGGYLDGAVYIVSEFLEQDNLVVLQKSTIEEDREYKVKRQGELLDIPLVVLINGGSASASEILAGALRDYDRATLVGTNTFGKGSVQEALDLSSGAGLHVTVAKWILPNGEWINGTGIAPQIEVENEIDDGNTVTRETDAQLDRAIEAIYDEAQ